MQGTALNSSDKETSQFKIPDLSLAIEILPGPHIAIWDELYILNAANVSKLIKKALGGDCVSCKLYACKVIYLETQKV